jgi:hypothetical protein
MPAMRAQTQRAGLTMVLIGIENSPTKVKLFIGNAIGDMSFEVAINNSTVSSNDFTWFSHLSFTISIRDEPDFG